MANLFRNRTSTSKTDEVPYNSIRTKTYNNIVETILCIAHKHRFIQDVNAGDIWEIDLEKNTLFPYFHCTTTSVDAREGTLAFNFQFFIMDLVEPHQSNEQQVLSDTLSTLLDILEVLKEGTDLNDNQHIWGIGEHTLEPFSERFDNAVAGWVVNVPIMVQRAVCNPELVFEDSGKSCIQ